MIRQSLDPDSAYVDAARHGDGLTSLQFRSTSGGVTREVQSNVSGPGRLRLEKRGYQFLMWVAGESGDLQFAGGSAQVELHTPYYVGIGVCAHRKDDVQTAVFWNLELRPAVTQLKATYSTVETVLLSGDARTALVSQKHLTNAGWTPDGKSITYDVDGKQQVEPFQPLATAASVGAPVSRRPENADPMVSTDGRFRLSISGGVGQLYPEVTLQVTNLADGAVRTLTKFSAGRGSLGPHPWSPDGKRIVLISYQLMQ